MTAINDPTGPEHSDLAAMPSSQFKSAWRDMESVAAFEEAWWAAMRAGLPEQEAARLADEAFDKEWDRGMR